MSFSLKTFQWLPTALRIKSSYAKPDEVQLFFYLSTSPSPLSSHLASFLFYKCTYPFMPHFFALAAPSSFSAFPSILLIQVSAQMRRHSGPSFLKWPIPLYLSLIRLYRELIIYNYLVYWRVVSLH